MRFVGGALEIILDAPPPLPYFATVSPDGHIIPWRNIAYAETL